MLKNKVRIKHVDHFWFVSALTKDKKPAVTKMTCSLLFDIEKLHMILFPSNNFQKYCLVSNLRII